jgi:hypothetical protein
MKGDCCGCLRSVYHTIQKDQVSMSRTVPRIFANPSVHQYFGPSEECEKTAGYVNIRSLVEFKNLCKKIPELTTILLITEPP